MPERAGFEFDWRFSVAEVHTSGPFSRFPHIDRNLAVLKGRMRLTVDKQRSPEILPHSASLSFDGNAETCAEVFEPVTDANLMTRRGLYMGVLEWIKIERAITIVEPHAEMILLTVDPIVLPGCELQPLDAIWCEAGLPTAIRPTSEAAWVLTAKIWRADVM